MTDTYLEAAVQIGRRLSSDASWVGDECSWVIPKLSRDAAGRRVLERVAAPGSLYKGSAGIALFLGELYGCTGDRHWLRTARGALTHAVRVTEGREIDKFGFHAGRVGVAFVASRLGDLTREAEWPDAARALLEPLFAQEDTDTALDVIGGAAGAIPALLVLSKSLSWPSLAVCARALGDHLVSRSVRGPLGWSWTGREVETRRLTGFAHGASGMAAAFVELFRATGDSGFRYAAEQAIAYEAAVFDPSQQAWPDYRSMSLLETLADETKRGDLGRKLRSGGPRPRFRQQPMAAWCHGAVGIGLARLRAAEVLGSTRCLEDAELAIAATMRSTHERQRDYSLCHGVFGTCALFLAGARALRRPSLADHAQSIIDEAVARFSEPKLRWACGDMGNDPSFMQGEAGIGHFLLRLSSPRMPSILLIESEPLLGQVAEDRASANELRRQDILRYFSGAASLIQSLAPEVGDALDGAVTSSSPFPIRDYVERVDQWLATHPGDPRHGQVLAALAPERVRFERELALVDFSEELLDDLIRLPDARVDWDGSVFALSPHVCLVEAAAHTQSAADDSAHADGPVPRWQVVHRRQHQIHLTGVGDFAAAVLLALRRPLTVEAMLDVLVADGAIGTGARAAWRKLVIQQVRQAYAIDLVRLAETKAQSVVAAADCAFV